MGVCILVVFTERREGDVETRTSQQKRERKSIVNDVERRVRFRNDPEYEKARAELRLMNKVTSSRENDIIGESSPT